MEKPCAVCGKRATHKIVKVVNGQLNERYYCNEHAAEADSLLASTHLQASLEELLTSLLSQAASQAQAAQAGGENDVKCGVCNLPFSLYRKTMILGCDRCYESFEDQLLKDLRKFHGSTRHAGRRPPNFKPNPTRAKPKPAARSSEAATPVASEEKKDASGVKVTTKGTPIKKSAMTAKTGAPAPQNLDALRAEMRQAVAAEDFERAAHLRDQIKELGKQP